LGGGIYSDQADGTVDGLNFNVGQDMPQVALEYNVIYDGGTYLGNPNIPVRNAGGLVIEIDQTWDLDLDQLYNPSVYDPNIAGGNKSIVQTYVQPDVAIVQDIIVEVELIQDFTQVQEIVQSVSQPIAATGTRLVSE